MKKITILLPAYNEEPSFPLIKESMEKVLRDNPIYEWEFLFINDGSTDNTLQQIIRLRNEDSHYSYIDLSRNYGKEIAMMAGFDNVSSDAVIIMDSDMQHPVDVIPEMIKWWEQGYDDVYAERAEAYTAIGEYENAVNDYTSAIRVISEQIQAAPSQDVREAQSSSAMAYFEKSAALNLNLGNREAAKSDLESAFAIAVALNDEESITRIQNLINGLN
jgi:glycosyltransferase involved in cell wall biosynthesis